MATLIKATDIQLGTTVEEAMSKVADVVGEVIDNIADYPTLVHPELTLSEHVKCDIKRLFKNVPVLVHKPSSYLLIRDEFPEACLLGRANVLIEDRQFYVSPIAPLNCDGRELRMSILKKRAPEEDGDVFDLQSVQCLWFSQ